METGYTFNARGRNIVRKAGVLARANGERENFVKDFNCPEFRALALEGYERGQASMEAE